MSKSGQRARQYVNLWSTQSRDSEEEKKDDDEEEEEEESEEASE